MPKQFIILNRKQALQAICLDLQSYETQTMLMAELMRIVYDDPAFVDRGPATQRIVDKRTRPE